MSKRERMRRYILFVFCLFFMGLGVALTKRGELGVSPISSVANVVSIRFPVLSFGNWLILSNCALILGQVLLLRKRFHPFQLLQLPLSVLFGYFTDFGMVLAEQIPNDVYWMQLLLVLIGVVVLGFGITLGVIANVILNSGEAFVQALADVTGKDFGNMKILFDVGWVLVSILLSLVFFGGQLVGTREGTLLSAVGVGLVVKVLRPILEKSLNKMLTK